MLIWWAGVWDVVRGQMEKDRQVDWGQRKKASRSLHFTGNRELEQEKKI